MFRNGMSYVTPFFTTSALNAIGGGAIFGIFAAAIVMFFPVTILLLILRGKALREKAGEPGWSRG